jgi:hypothetical protein
MAEIELDAELVERAAQVAAARGQKLEDVIVRLLAEYVGEPSIED